MSTPAALVWMSFFYCVGGAILQGFAIILFALLGWPKITKLDWRDYFQRYLSRIARFVLFSLLLFGWGFAGNVAWCLVAVNRLYVATETCGDVTPFLPYVPFGRWSIEGVSNGSHLLDGVTMTQMQLLWLAIGLPVWVFTILSYRAAIRHVRDHRSASPTAAPTC